MPALDIPQQILKSRHDKTYNRDRFRDWVFPNYRA